MPIRPSKRRRAQDDEALELVNGGPGPKTFTEDQVYGMFAKAMGAVPPATRQGKSVDVRAFLAAASKGLAPELGNTPEDIAQAIVEQGMDFTEPFAPGEPLRPWYGYGKDPRQWDYTPGRNISSQPRSDRLPFITLKTLYESYDVAQICVRHIISDLLSMELKFTPMDGVSEEVDEDIAKAKAFWAKPDGKRRFRHWLSMYLQDVLRYDAGTLFKRRSNDGKLLAPWSPGIRPGDRYGLGVISGTTIAPMVDYFGDIPIGKAPAFVQFVNGMAWDWIAGRDLIYEPYTPFPESVYGLAPIESVLLNSNTDIRFQWHFLNYFTQGNLPEGFMEAPADMSSPGQVEEWQEYWDAVMMGDQTKLRQIRFVPHDSKYVSAKDATFDEKFPEYLMRRTVASYGLVPQDLGFVADVNRANGETQVDVQFRISTQPRVGFIEDILNEITQDELHLRVQVNFDTGQEKEDRLQEAQAWKLYCDMGAASPDEPREKVLGLPTNPEEIIPRTISTRAGLVPIKNIVELAGKIDPETGAPEPGSVTPLDVSGYVVPTSIPPAKGSTPPGSTPPGPAAPPDGPPAPPPDGGAPTAPAAPAADQVTKAETGGITAGTGITGSGLVDDDEDEDLDDEELTKALADWRTNSKRRIRNGKRPRVFSDIPSSVSEPIWGRLVKATSSAEVDKAFDQVDVTVAGLLVKALDTGRILLLQRAMDDTDPAGGCWEIPGGHLEDDESPLDAAKREWAEETGCTLPAGTVASNWVDGIYQGYVHLVDAEFPINPDDPAIINPDDPDGDVTETVAWWDISAAQGMPGLRAECHKSPWDQIRSAGQVAKASGDADPKEWADHPGRPFHEALVEHYSAKWRHALKSATTGIDKAIRAYQSAHQPINKAEKPPEDQHTDQHAESAVTQNVSIDPATMRQVLNQMQADSYIAGTHIAAGQSGGAGLTGSMGKFGDTGIDWDNWQPGWDKVTDFVTGSNGGPGLAQMLADDGVTISDVTGTTFDRLSTVLADGVSSGDSVDTIASAMADVLDDPSRADMIANTEVNRAMTSASMDTYRNAGIGQWDLLAEPSACQICADVASNNPHDISDTDTAPYHPNCRCAVSPVVPTS